MSGEETGGYDYQFVDPGPSDDQKCPICCLVIKDAQQVTCCGKLFCKTCLQRVELQDTSCPHCRQNFNGKYFPDVRGNRDIKNLKVLCGYESAGCEWSGELRDVEKHMADCLRKEVECPKCGERKLQILLDKHEQYDCLLREYTCPHCDIKGAYLSIATDHLEKCPEAEVICLNQGCTSRMKRKDLSHHICQMQKVNCPFCPFGCKFYNSLCLLSDHNETAFSSHMELFAKWVEQQSAEVQEAVKRSRALSSPNIAPPTPPSPTAALRSAPLVLKFTEFMKHKKADKDIKEWLSDDFYTGPGGYKMRLRMFPYGTGDGESTHVSVFINLMPGEYDDMVEFPIKGSATVTLLNQLSNKNHHNISFNFDGTNQFKYRKHVVDTAGFGWQQFVEHRLLQQAEISYLQNDTIYFRVNVHIESHTKPWLVQ